MLISELFGNKEEAFIELVKEKLMDPPWNFNAYNNSSWNVGANKLTASMILSWIFLAEQKCYLRLNMLGLLGL